MHRIGVVDDGSDGHPLGGNGGIKNDRAWRREGAAVACPIDHLGDEDSGAVDGERRGGCVGPDALSSCYDGDGGVPGDDAIAGDAQSFTDDECRTSRSPAERACEGWRGVVGDGAIGDRTLDGADVVADVGDGHRRGGSGGVEDEGAAGTRGPLVACGINDAGGDGVGAVGDEGGCGAPGGTADFGINEEAGAVVELERFTLTQSCREAACKGGGGVIGAAAGRHGSLKRIGVVDDGSDGRRLSGSGNIDNDRTRIREWTGDACAGEDRRFEAMRS